MTTRGPIRISPSGRFLRGNVVGDGLLWDGSEWAASAVSGVFGQDFQEVEATSLFSTTSTTRVTALSLTTPALTGRYRIGSISVMDVTTGGTVADLAMRNVTDAVDLVSILVSPAPTAIIAPDSWRDIDFTGASKTIEIQVARVTGGGAVNLNYRAIQIWRVQ